MSVNAVGGFNPVQFASLAPAKAQEAGEVRGAPDHDGDSDDAKAQAASTRPGHIDVKA